MALSVNVVIGFKTKGAYSKKRNRNTYIRVVQFEKFEETLVICQSPCDSVRRLATKNFTRKGDIRSLSVTHVVRAVIRSRGL